MEHPQEPANMRRTYRWYAAWALLAGTLVALLVAAGGSLAWHVSSAREFAQMRTRWQQLPVPHYRLVIERPILACRQDMVILNGHIIDGWNSCETAAIPSLTVAELFDRIAMLDGMQMRDMLTTELCVCVSQLDASVRYDATLAYPSEVTINEERSVDWWRLDCWQRLVSGRALPDCTLSAAAARPRITTISLTPLPALPPTEAEHRLPPRP